MSDKNRFKALLSDTSSNNRWNNGNRNNKFHTQQNNRWKNNSEKRNAFQSKRKNKRSYGRNKVAPDPNFKPNLVGRGEVSFVPQVQKTKQQKKKKEILKPITKEEETVDDGYVQMTDEDLKLTLALAEKYQYITESDEEYDEDGEEGEEGEEGDKDNSAW